MIKEKKKQKLVMQNLFANQNFDYTAQMNTNQENPAIRMFSLLANEVLQHTEMVVI